VAGILTKQEISFLTFREISVEKGGVKMAWCPECRHSIEVSKSVKLGANIECPECGTMLEVISLSPLELDYALEDEEREEEERWEEV
jgi:alpha-aminoadipate carrier protein LysW